MEIFEANVIADEGNYYLEFFVKDKKLKISLTEDKPKEVKSFFNELILELKKSEFTFELKDKSENLYYQISDEYIKQLNEELKSVRQELVDYNLLDKIEHA